MLNGNSPTNYLLQGLPTLYTNVANEFSIVCNDKAFKESFVNNKSSVDFCLLHLYEVL